MIFNHNEVAAFIIRKICRMFVYSDIDEATEVSFRASQIPITGLMPGLTIKTIQQMR